MKKVSIVILFILTVVVFSSCVEITTEKIRSYVISYTDIDSIKLSITDSGNIEIITANKDYVDWRSKGRYKVIYDSVCNAHHDMNYNKATSYVYYPAVRSYFIGRIKSISILSDVSFDNSHPAGADLKDLVCFISTSPEKFIESGYTDTFNWDDDSPDVFKKEFKHFSIYEGAYNFPYVWLLSEIKPEGTDIVGFGGGITFGYLIFQSSPQLNKTHNLTVTLTTSNGSVFTRTIQKTFK